MATRAEIRTYLMAEFEAVEFEHGMFRMELITSKELDRSHIVYLKFGAMQSYNSMILLAPFADVADISADAAFEFTKDNIFGNRRGENTYDITTTLFYDAMDTTSIAEYIWVFAIQADEIERDLGLGDKF
jgi:hypothetical protein